MARKAPLEFVTAFSRFTTDKIVGQGGSGTVYRAKDESGLVVAIKRLDPSKATSEKRKRFENEIHFCLRGPHANIVPVLDYGVIVIGTQQSPFYVMPFYPQSLRDLIKRGIPARSALNHFKQILDGVEAAHLLGVVHRDLKPENIFLDAQLENAVIGDFGIAHFSEDLLHTPVETGPASRLANFQYAAPEQRVRGATVDQRADIFALGLILSEMFTGQLRLGTNATPIGSISSEFAYLDGLVDMMLCQRPADRPDSIDEIKRELIGRGNEFVSRQRLSTLTQAVVPSADVDDPLILDPPRLVNADWRSGELRLQLSQYVTSKWVNEFMSIRTPTKIGPPQIPRHVRIAGDLAVVSNVSKDYEAQNAADRIKEWLLVANEAYGQLVRREQAIREKESHERLRAEIAAEQERLKILQAVKL